MFFATLIRDGGRTLVRNKLRSGLTVLGITIGIAAVICVVAIGQAGSVQIQKQLENLGDNFIWVEAGGRNVNGIRTGNGQTKTLTEGDAKAILQQIPLIKAVSANVDGSVQVVYQGQNWATRYNGVSPSFFDIKKWTFALGGPFSQDDVDHASEVCVLGNTVKQNLF